MAKKRRMESRPKPITWEQFEDPEYTEYNTAHTVYNAKYHPQLLKFMTRSGMTKEEIAAELHLHVSLISEWKSKYPKIAEALNENKDFTDSLVEDSLLKNALGYSYEEKSIEIEELILGNENGNGNGNGNGKGNGNGDGELEISRTRLLKRRTRTTVKIALPNTTSQIFWLKNRQPDRWREKKELSFPDGVKLFVSEDFLPDGSMDGEDERT